MPTNFVFTKGHSKQEMDKHFVVKKEWQKEREHVMNIEKELKKTRENRHFSSSPKS